MPMYTAQEIQEPTPWPSVQKNAMTTEITSAR